MPLTVPYQPHSPTSGEAAESIEQRGPSLRARVLETIRREGGHGLTDEELQERLRMNPSTERPRRIELCKLGLVVDSCRTRATRSGRKAAVWIAAIPGEQLKLGGVR